jgi:D-alanine transaminase
MRIYLNGRYVAAEDAVVSVTDRGFLFGDGVYEVTRAAGGELIDSPRHVRRFNRSLREMSLSLGENGVADMMEASRVLLRDNAIDGDALVYWQVTRGAAPRLHQFPPAGTPPTVLVSTGPVALPHAIRARGATAITTPDIRWARCDIKSVNLLPNVFAKQRAVASGADEAIFVRDGVVTEGASSNVFGVLDGEIRTYPLSNLILPGVTREVVIELASENDLPVVERPLWSDDLARVTELFFTSTFNDVMPIVRVDGRPIGTGRPGPVSQQLYAAFVERLGSVAAAV